MENTLNFDSPIALMEYEDPDNPLDQIDIYLFVDWENGAISAQPYNYRNREIPIRESRGLISSFHLPNNVNAEELGTAINRFYLSRFDKIQNGFVTKLEGLDQIGVFSDASRQEIDFVRKDLMNGIDIRTFEIMDLISATYWFDMIRGSPEYLTNDITPHEIETFAEIEYNLALDSGITLWGGRGELVARLTYLSKNL